MSARDPAIFQQVRNSTRRANQKESALRDFLNGGGDANIRDSYGVPLLHFVVQGKTPAHINMLRSLLADGADVNAMDRRGGTALYQAAFYNNLDGARALIGAGANLNIVPIDGFSMLMEAAGGGNEPMMRLLIDAGADVNARDEEGWTALMGAAAKECVGCVKLLLDAGADASVQDINGRFALLEALPNIEVAKLLVEHGADPETIRPYLTEDQFTRLTSWQRRLPLVGLRAELLKGGRGKRKNKTAKKSKGRRIQPRKNLRPS